MRIIKKQKKLVISQLIEAGQAIQIAGYNKIITATVPFNQSCPEQDSNVSQRRIAVFEDCKATALTTWPPLPPWLVN